MVDLPLSFASGSSGYIFNDGPDPVGNSADEEEQPGESDFMSPTDPPSISAARGLDSTRWRSTPVGQPRSSTTTAVTGTVPAPSLNSKLAFSSVRVIVSPSSSKGPV